MYRSLKYFFSNPLATIGVIIIALFVLMSIAPQLFTRYDPYGINTAKDFAPRVSKTFSELMKWGGTSIPGSFMVQG